MTPNPNADWKDIPIPELMKNLPLDKRGYPCPFILWEDEAGTHHFTINDTKKRGQCILMYLCAICGKPLEKVKWFVGGPLSAFDPNGAYVDTAMHHECTTYALQVCPYLSMPKYLGRIDTANLDWSKVPVGTMFMDPTVIPVRPPVFVAVSSRKFTWHDYRDGNSFVKPGRPYEAVEFWRDGVQLTEAEGIVLASEALGRELKRTAVDFR